MKRIYNFIASNRNELFFVAFIFILAATLRLWKIDQYLTFLGDEGRDVRVVRDLIRGNLVFIGPMTSIGNMYLGPLYYYMMAPALFLSGFNPVGPAIMVALLGSVTVIFTWWVGRTWFNTSTGLLASFLFAVSPVAIIYSRASWNPNPMPFFALLSVWAIWQAWQKKNYLYISLTSAALAFALQMHYLALLLIPTLGIYWLLSLKSVWKDAKRKGFLIHSLAALSIFIFLMSPLVLFDLKHNGQNFNAFKQFFTDRQTTINLNPSRSDRFLPAIQSVTAELLLGRQLLNSTAVALVIGITCFWAYFGRTKVSLKNIFKNRNSSLSILVTWILFGILGLGIYKQHIYAHYFGFLFPAIYLLIGYLLSFLWQKGSLFKFAAIASFAYLFYFAIVYSPLKQSPNRQLQRTEQVVDLIIKESGEEEFNFGLIAKQNYDESYRYFLENKQSKLVRGEERITSQLFVVCEDGDKCQPEGNPQWQIAVFGPSTVQQQWQVDYIKVYKLVKTE